MKPSKVLKKFARGEPVYSLKACYQDPEIVEMMGQSGIDCVWICLEHRRYNPTILDSLIRSCRLSEIDALIRVSPATHSDLLYLLEAGAHGIMIPQVRHPDEVRKVVRMMKFPPLGNRGIDTVHADSGFGRVQGLEYMASANANTFLAVQIETSEIIEHIEELAAIEGVDMLFVGIGDLSSNIGKTGQIDSDEVQAILHKVLTACRKNGKVAAIPCSNFESARKYAEMGFGFLNVGSDFRFIRNGIDNTQSELDKLMS